LADAHLPMRGRIGSNAREGKNEGKNVTSTFSKVDVTFSVS
jgi:hypothetical protein